MTNPDQHESSRPSYKRWIWEIVRTEGQKLTYCGYSSMEVIETMDCFEPWQRSGYYRFDGFSIMPYSKMGSIEDISRDELDGEAFGCRVEEFMAQSPELL